MAFTTLPTFLVGKVFAADLAALSSAIAELRSPRKVMTADQALTTSSITLQNLTGMSVPVITGTYRWHLMLSYSVTSSNVPDIKVALTFPTASTATYTYLALNLAAAGSPPYSLDMGGGSLTSGTAFVSAGSVGLRATIQAYGVFVVTAAGNVQVQAAQNTSDANAVTVHAGTFLDLAPIV